MKSRPVELETRRLRLRRWRRQDREPFAAIHADQEAMRHFPSPLSGKQSDTLTLRIETAPTGKNRGFWTVVSKSDGRSGGFIGIENGNPARPCSPCVEIGQRLGSAHWHHGYATEAAHAWPDFPFQILATN